jgi:hypothetical protein
MCGKIDTGLSEREHPSQRQGGAAQMPKIAVELSLAEIKQALSQLSATEIQELIKGLPEQWQTQAIMQTAESAFSEWLEPEEDIYNE